MRRALRATFSSCVTMMIVRPPACNWSKSAMMSALVLVSRLPVGSSARRTAGSLTRARAIATRCCWPPESSLGLWCAAVGQADFVERRERRARVRSRVLTPA